jgi:hypothetical protein
MCSLCLSMSPLLYVSSSALPLLPPTPHSDDCWASWARIAQTTRWPGQLAENCRKGVVVLEPSFCEDTGVDWEEDSKWKSKKLSKLGLKLQKRMVWAVPAVFQNIFWFPQRSVFFPALLLRHTTCFGWWNEWKRLVLLLSRGSKRNSVETHILSSFHLLQLPGTT